MNRQEIEAYIAENITGKTSVSNEVLGTVFGEILKAYALEPIQPLAPTNGAEDLENYTFTFAKNPLFTVSQHEYRYRISGGTFTSWTTCQSLVISLDNANINSGDLQIRVKAINGNLAGAVLANQQGFEETVIVGRQFIIGVNEGASDILVDGNDNSKPWYPLQAYDTFAIQAGQYAAIKFNNMAVSSGWVKITNHNGIINAHEVNIGGTTPHKNVWLDFYNKVAGQQYGLQLNPPSDFGGEKLILNRNQVGGNENVRVSGVSVTACSDRCFWLGGNYDLLYNNGAGVKNFSGLIIENCAFISDTLESTPRSSAIFMGGKLEYYDADNHEDRGYTENVIIRNIHLEGGNWEISGGNLHNFLIQNITMKNLQPYSTHHAAIVDVAGWGVVENIRATGSYGNMVKFRHFNRTSDGTKLTSIVRNSMADGNRKYSLLQINQYETGFCLWPGVTAMSYLDVEGLTTSNMATGKNFDGTNFADPGFRWDGTCVETFNGDFNGAGLTIKNCVSVNPHQTAVGPPLSVLNGNAEFKSNNFAYPDNSLTKLSDYIDFIPASDSILKGAGIASDHLALDINGLIRRDPPTVGAVEAA